MPEPRLVPRPSVWERLAAPDTTKHELACELTLLFHSGSPWDGQKSQDWQNLLVRIYDHRVGICFDVTTKVLCDAIRHAVG